MRSALFLFRRTAEAEEIEKWKAANPDLEYDDGKSVAEEPEFVHWTDQDH